MAELQSIRMDTHRHTCLERQKLSGSAFTDVSFGAPYCRVRDMAPSQGPRKITVYSWTHHSLTCELGQVNLILSTAPAPITKTLGQFRQAFSESRCLAVYRKQHLHDGSNLQLNSLDALAACPHSLHRLSASVSPAIKRDRDYLSFALHGQLG